MAERISRSERALHMYDRGYQFDRYDLVVTAIRALDATLSTFGQLALTVLELKRAHARS